MMFFLTVSLSGCEPKKQHEVLTFFFTGVPPLEETAAVKSDQELQDIRKTTPGQKTAQVQNLYSHPVWAAGACDPCHGSTGIFSTPGVQKQPQTVFKTGGGMPGELILPKTKLCTQCHRDKTPLRALTERLWLHNTTAKGDCLACHDPHQSKNKNTLRKPPVKICLSCHENGTFMATPAHQTGEDCLSCHTPHMGLNKNLLKNEYQEQKTPALQIPETMVQSR